MAKFKSIQIDEKKWVYDLESFPEEIKNTWMHIVKLDRHPHISYVVAIYKNDDFPEGTIILSPYFYHKYPDFYALEDKEVNAFRIYTNPIYRGQKHWKGFPMILRNFFYYSCGIYSDVGKERSLSGEMLYKSLKKMADMPENEDPAPNNRTVVDSEVNPPRDPCYPNVWYNQRIERMISVE
jgi:hypothetical protein